MKKNFLLCLACVLALLCALPAAVSEQTGDAVELPWLTYTLEVRLFSDDDAYVQEDLTARLPLPTGRYVILRLAGVDRDLQAEDIIQYSQFFALTNTAEDVYYTAASYVMHGMDYDMTSGQFSTNEMQPDFDLYFDVPSDIPLDDITLVVASLDGEFSWIDMTTAPRELDDLLYVEIPIG